MSTDQVVCFLRRWRATLLTAAAGGTVVVTMLTWGSEGIAWLDNRYVTRYEIGEDRLKHLAELDPDDLVTKQDLKPLNRSIEFIELSYIEDKIAQLDGRIQALENVHTLSRDERRTLNELRLKRSQLRFRLEGLSN